MQPVCVLDLSPRLTLFRLMSEFYVERERETENILHLNLSKASRE